MVTEPFGQVPVSVGAAGRVVKFDGGGGLQRGTHGVTLRGAG
jgi:hypothetical protein